MSEDGGGTGDQCWLSISCHGRALEMMKGEIREITGEL